MKLAHEYNAADLTDYLLKKAAELGLASSFTPRGLLRRAYANLLKEWESPILLVLVTDHLLKGYVHEVGVSERLLTRATVEISIREMGGTQQFWRYIYYSRFARPGWERGFFNYWIGMLDDAEQAGEGSVPNVRGLPGPSVYTWEDVVNKAHDQLEQGIAHLIERAKQKPLFEEEVAVEDEPQMSRPEVPVTGIMRRGRGARTT